jgi:hypothetical protein
MRLPSLSRYRMLVRYTQMLLDQTDPFIAESEHFPLLRPAWPQSYLVAVDVSFWGLYHSDPTI